MSKSRILVSTAAHLNCSSQAAWEKVCFYEHITLQPSWLLRAILPVPMQTTGAYRSVGDVSRCLYSDGGFLTKRITRIAPGECVEFEIIEQSIRYSGWIALQGGTIQVVAHADGTCSVQMMTRCELPAWLASVGFCVSAVVKAMHGIVIADMQHRLAVPASTRQRHATLSAEDAVRLG